MAQSNEGYSERGMRLQGFVQTYGSADFVTHGDGEHSLTNAMGVTSVRSLYEDLGIKRTAGIEDLYRALCLRESVADQMLLSDEVKAQFSDILHTRAKQAYDRKLLEPTVLSIARKYDSLLTQAEKDDFSGRLTSGEHARMRICSGCYGNIAFKEACADQFLCSTEEREVDKMWHRCSIILEDLADLKIPRTYFYGTFGAPGTGKTTSRVALLLFVLYGGSFESVIGSANAALKNLLQGMGGELDAFLSKYTSDSAQVRQLLGLPANHYLFGTCTSNTNKTVMKGLLEAGLELALPPLVVIQLDEFEQLRDLPHTASNRQRQRLFEAMQEFLESGETDNLLGKGFKWKEGKPAILFVYSGNLAPRTQSIDASGVYAKEEDICEQLFEFMGGKFGSNNRALKPNQVGIATPPPPEAVVGILSRYAQQHLLPNLQRGVNGNFVVGLQFTFAPQLFQTITDHCCNGGYDVRTILNGFVDLRIKLRDALVRQPLVAGEDCVMISPTTDGRSLQVRHRLDSRSFTLTECFGKRQESVRSLFPDEASGPGQRMGQEGEKAS